MQRLFDRVAAHFASVAVLRSGSVARAAEPHAPQPQRLALILERLADRWQSSPDLLGEEKTQDALVIGLFGAFSLIGWLMLMQGYEQFRQARAIEAWPTTVGTILAVDLQSVDGGKRFRPQITYVYAVNGRVITASRITPGKAPLMKNEVEARDYVSRYLPQTPVKVRYNPAEITESVLQPATPRSAYLNLTLGAGLACLGPALFIVVGMPVSRRRGWLLWRRP